MSASPTSSTTTPATAWEPFSQAPAPPIAKTIINFKHVLEAFENLDKAAQEIILSTLKKAHIGQFGAYHKTPFESPSSRPLFLAGNSRFIIFKSKKLGDKLIDRGADAKVYHAYDLEKGKLRAYISMKGNVEKNLRMLQIVQANKLGPKILGFCRVKTSNTSCFGYKIGVIEELFQCNLQKAIDHRYIDMKSEATQLAVLRQTAQELALVHAAGLIHRDVKFPNFLFNRNKNGEPVIKIADFGYTLRKSTQNFGWGGSALHASPECFMQENSPVFRKTYLTEQHDGWALGITWLKWGVANNPHTCFKCGDEFYGGPFDSFIYFKKGFILSGHRRSREDFLTLLQSVGTSKADWIPQPDKANTFEFVVWNLLRTDPALRWSPLAAVQYLDSIPPPLPPQ